MNTCTLQHSATGEYDARWVNGDEMEMKADVCNRCAVVCYSVLWCVAVCCSVL